MSSLCHENIVKMYGITPSSNWIVLEWLSDNTLLQFLKSRIGKMTTIVQMSYVAAQVNLRD